MMSSKSSVDYGNMTTKDLRSLLTSRGFDCSQCVEKSDLIAAAQRIEAAPDFDEEARKLFQQVNLFPSNIKSRYTNLDPIWKHPVTGACVYVGNATAAADRRTLRERNIGAVMNCQGESSKNHFENDPDMVYYRFVVSKLAVSNHRFCPFEYGFREAFDFMDDHLKSGTSVLVHCLAGAHRAGTVGTAWLMYKTGKGVQDALVLAKACRPIISPFATLLEILQYLEKEFRENPSKTQTNI
jgi:hypothetical protein